MKRIISNAAEKRPNLIFRKAKMAGKSVEKYAAKKIKIPLIDGEALYGIHSVLEALRAEKREFHKIFVKKSIEKRAEKDAKVREILEIVENRKIEMDKLSDDQLDRLTEFQLHNGICMDVSGLPFSDYTPRNTSIFFDKVLDPGNLGAIGRSAWYFGAEGISFAKGRGPKKITPSMSKSSCGALEHLAVQQVNGFEEYREMIKSNGGEVIATCDPESAKRAGVTSKPLNLWKPAPIVGIVLGDEGVGINYKTLNLCDQVISIQSVRQDRSNVTSLNVSVVAGILLHYISTSRHEMY